MKIINDLLAAITFFTRLPAWRIKPIPHESYKSMSYFWPFTGWITALLTVTVWYLLAIYLPVVVAIILSLALRVLLTGGLHEDGLADFFDGFGGGKTSSDVLRIMKDSHVGSYAVIALVFYFLLLVSTLTSMPRWMIPLALATADPLSKFITTLLMNVLPYARPENESKTKTIYEQFSWWKWIIAFSAGSLPLFYLFDFTQWIIALFPLATMLLMLVTARKKIKAYTGDVCGATALLCELSFYIGLLLLV